jgi:hypothetical protein
LALFTLAFFEESKQKMPGMIDSLKERFRLGTSKVSDDESKVMKAIAQELMVSSNFRNVFLPNQFFGESDIYAKLFLSTLLRGDAESSVRLLSISISSCFPLE